MPVSESDQTLSEIARKSEAIGIILGCLQDHGPQTIDEIAKRTQLTSVQVARRTSDMHKRGMAEPTGSTRLSASGRNERVWGQ